MHLIPRYKGDVENPKGGVRGVIPAKQHYTTRQDEAEDASPPKMPVTLEERRMKHGNAYIPWNEEADRVLCRMYDEGKSISLLADIFERTRGAIYSRLIKLGKLK